MFEELCESGPDFELADIVFGVMENKSLEGDDHISSWWFWNPIYHLSV